MSPQSKADPQCSQKLFRKEDPAGGRMPRKNSWKSPKVSYRYKKIGHPVHPSSFQADWSQMTPREKSRQLSWGADSPDVFEKIRQVSPFLDCGSALCRLWLDEHVTGRKLDRVPLEPLAMHSVAPEVLQGVPCQSVHSPHSTPPSKQPVISNLESLTLCHSSYLADKFMKGLHSVS